MTPTPRRLACQALAATALASLAAPLLAQTGAAAGYPNKPIKFIVPYTPGGTTDLIARTIGQKLTEAWGQQVIVENRPGAAGWLGIQGVAKSPADGYTIGLTISNIIYAKSLYAKLPFDIDKDFEPVSMLSRSALGLVVPASLPVNTVEEYVAMARKPGANISYGSFGQGTTANIFGETLNLHSKINVTHVPYKGMGPLVTDLLGGQISSAWMDTASLVPLVQSGKLKTLAMTGTKRINSVPNVPTFQELGYKGFEPVGFFLVLAPAGTPKDVVGKLSGGIAKALQSPEFSAKLRELGQEPVGSTAEELGREMKTLAEFMDRTIKATNIKVDQ
ncbi:MAG: tripartite tricarboxylate transporter substrate binding protein [Burkholderiaceae bacterium]|nr:tripartite tricarboxylate transporter substrate binding protein [Burkholderiaceae bacterium]